MDEFYFKLGLCFVAAGIIYWLMDRALKKKIKDADHQFELTLKSHGMVNHIQDKEEIYDPFQHKIVSKSELRRVAVMAQERVDLPDIQCPVVKHAETILAEKEEALALKKKKKYAKRKTKRGKKK